MIEDETTRAVRHHVKSAILALNFHERLGEFSIDEALSSLTKAQNWLEEAKNERSNTSTDKAY